MAENYRSPYGIWWDENIQGKYGVGESVRELMAMAFEGGRKSRDAEIEALKKAIIEYADCVGSKEGTDFIDDLKYMGTSEESIALLYKLNGYDENGDWIHKKKASEK